LAVSEVAIGLPLSIATGAYANRQLKATRAAQGACLYDRRGALPARLRRHSRAGYGFRQALEGQIGEGNGTDVTFSGAIDLVEHLREVQILYLDLPGTTEKFLIKVDGESSFARLQDVRFTARLQDIHIFDAEGNVIPVSAGATV
jgi:alpha-glucoside transport system ATP-binding protein